MESESGAHRSWEDLWSHSKRKGKKEKIANHIWSIDVREKPQTQEQIDTHSTAGWERGSARSKR